MTSNELRKIGINRGERAEQHGKIQLTGAEAAEYDRMADKMAFMHSRISNRFPYFGPYTACWCGSGKKMNWCPQDRASRRLERRVSIGSHNEK